MSTSAIPRTDRVDTHRLRDLLNNDPDVRILDVRSASEFATTHIPGSYNVPLDTLGEHLRELADVDHPVVLVCQSGGRATQAHEKLTGAGKEALHILDGGIAAWESGGGDVVRGTSNRWAMDRQVRLVAGSLVVAGLAVSTVVPNAKWLAAAVGAGLAYSAISNTCTMAAVLSKLPYNQADGCDIDGVLAGMSRKES